MNNIEFYRKAKNLSQEKLAELSGLSTGYICHLERGTRENPSKITMQKIATVLGKTVTEVFKI